MSHGLPSRIGRQLLLAIAAALLVSVNLAVAASPASADPATPREILKSMSDYIAAQQCGAPSISPMGGEQRSARQTDSSTE
jgi:Spy/CpxP family protein refolding chaperone